MPIIKVNDASHFQTNLTQAGPKLVVVDFTAKWYVSTQAISKQSVFLIIR